MSEIDITNFFRNAAPMDYSASVVEIGANAGADTWRAAVDDSSDYMLLDTDDLRAEFRRYVKAFGAWDEAHIAAWSDVELNALLLQLIAGDIRESDLHSCSDDADWSDYEARSAEGQVSGRLFRSDENRIYYVIGE